MPLLPVAAREARGAARSWRNYAWRTLIAAIGLALVFAVLSTTRNPAVLGQQLFMTLMLTAFLYCTVAGVLRTADAIAEEKRENTLGLLFLTDLKAYDVLTGKLLASSVTIFFGLLALLPMLTIPLLMGGVSFQLVLLASLSLLNTLFLSISFGFLMSTLLRQAWAAICLGLVAMFFLTFALPQLVSVFFSPSSIFYALTETVLLFSPTGGLRGLDLAGTGQATRFFWSNLASVHLLAWINIVLTLGLLPIVWRDNPRNARAQAWWNRMQTLRFGGAKTRTKFRARLLKSNPLFWLAGREQVSSSGLMALLVGVVVISIAGDWEGVIFGLVTLHLILLARMASAASHNLAEDRKSGALELLLATSLSVRDVLRGRWMALGRQFFGPILIVSLWHLFGILWTSLLGQHDETSFAIFCIFPVAFLAWVATCWSGMWFGLRARTPTMAMWITFTVVALAPAFFLGLLGTATGQWAPGVTARDNATAIFMGLFLWAIYLSFLSTWSANRLRTCFREAATDRFNEHVPFDWHPVRRFAVRFAVVLLAISALVFLWRWSVNIRGERAFQRALAAHPQFSRQSPELPNIPSEKNLARWDFFPAMENNSLYANRSYSTPRPPSLRDLIRPMFTSSSQIYWTFGVRTRGPRPGQGAVQRYEQEFARLHAAAAERPFLRFFPQQNIQPSAIENLQALQRELCMRASGRILAGERPVDDVLLALRFATASTNHVEDFRHLEFMILQGIQPVYDGFITNRWTDQDLLAIQRAYEQVDLFPAYDQWRFEVTRRLLDFIENRSAIIARFFDHVFTKQSRNSNALLGRIRKQQVEIIQFGLTDLAPPADREKRIMRPATKISENPVVRDFQSIARQSVRQTARAQTAVDQVVIACAIERFRHATGHIPENLSELIPNYLKKIPNDIALGEPLKYIAQAEKSYVLYSIGFDFIDHGGSVSQFNGYPADWAWICKR